MTDRTETDNEHAAAPWDQWRAWLIHAFTAIGMVPALLSLVAVLEGDAPMVLVWLGVSLLIDGFDGPLARRYRVAERLPKVDGAVLDHVIDYTTYALIPALFIYRFGFMPDGLHLVGSAYVLITSLYCFANRDMKTKDNFFSGFPAAWNLVILYFFVLDSPPFVNFGLVLLLGVLTFVPMKFIHPFRVAVMRPVTIVVTVVWAAAALYLVLTSGGADAQPAIAAPLAFWAFVAASVYHLALSLWRSVRGRAG